MMAIEIEKKYRLTPERRVEIEDDLAEFRAEFCGDDFEENTIFSNSGLVVKHAVVRIRKTEKRSVLTFKQRTDSTSGAKHQIEHESEISNADAVRIILENLGLRAVLVYEKKRRTYKFKDAELVLDELPFGLYMEIEGSLTAIAESEMLLGLDDLDVENETYPRLTARLGHANGDVVEARFV
jgi:adenylate cyclase class 2